jgi:hypothetical protein
VASFLLNLEKLRSLRVSYISMPPNSGHLDRSCSQSDGEQRSGEICFFVFALSAPNPQKQPELNFLTRTMPSQNGTPLTPFRHKS